MRRPWWAALILVGSIVGVAVAAGGQDALEHNRRLLERWRTDPEHYGRLLRDLRAFYGLPRQRQERLRLLDQELAGADGPTQARLMAVLERYNAWLESLTDEQRLHILHAPDEAVRLARIRELRLREWLPRLPTGEQRVVARLPDDQQPDRIAAFRADERRQRAAWYREWIKAQAAIPKPTRLSELPPTTREFVEAHLMRRLLPSERKSLTEAEGKFPEWARQLLALSEKHPVLPPGPHGEIKSPVDLMKIRGEKLPKKSKALLGLSKLKGHWPEFALAIQKIQVKGTTLPPLGASKPAEFSREIQVFLNKNLLPKLDNKEKTLLEKTQGQWPQYPLMLHDLARHKRLVIPGMSMPGPPEMWDGVRAATGTAEPSARGRKRFDGFP